MELTTQSDTNGIYCGLFMMSKIQNLNGTHNHPIVDYIKSLVVYDVKDTKFEWNSQHTLFASKAKTCCLWCQRYKIWMELTTWWACCCCFALLFMMSKIQNLNGTHNYLIWHVSIRVVVYDVKDTKFEWNSQLIWRNCGISTRCLWCQRYKIWMELTTAIVYTGTLSRLFMMSKIQNLNGTHNNTFFSIK